MTLSKIPNNGLISIIITWLVLATAFPRTANGENESQLLTKLESPELNSTVRVSAARELLKHLDDPTVRNVYKKYLDKIHVPGINLRTSEPETYFPLAELLGFEISQLDWQLDEYLNDKNQQTLALWERVIEIKLLTRIDIITPLRQKLVGADIEAQERAKRFLSRRRVQPGPPPSHAELKTGMDEVEITLLSFLERTESSSPYDNYPGASKTKAQGSVPHSGASLQPDSLEIQVEKNAKVSSSTKRSLWPSFLATSAIILIILVAGWGFMRWNKKS